VFFVFLGVYPSYHTTHTKEAERRAEESRRRRGASAWPEAHFGCAIKIMKEEALSRLPAASAFSAECGRFFYFFVSLSYLTTHTKKAERGAERSRRRQGASAWPEDHFGCAIKIMKEEALSRLSAASAFSAGCGRVV